MCNKAPDYDDDRVELLLECANEIAARKMSRAAVREAFQCTGAQAGSLMAADANATFDMKKLRWIAYRLHIDYVQTFRRPTQRMRKERLRAA